MTAMTMQDLAQTHAIDSRIRMVDVFQPYFYNSSRYLVLWGSAGSGKSRFAAEKILLRILNEETTHRFLCVRKVAATLRDSCYMQFKEIIRDWSLGHLFNCVDSRMEVICLCNGSTVLFKGLDDIEKMKSITGITGIWVEEATETHPHDLLQLDRRLRDRTKYYKQIIITFNPISRRHWLKDYFFDKPSAYTAQRTTKVWSWYKDNKFLEEDYTSLLDTATGNWQTVYSKGLWGDSEGLIYDVPAIKNVFDYPVDCTKRIYGLDFGFSNPSALVEIRVVDALPKMQAWLSEHIYASGLTTADLIAYMDDLCIEKNVPIYADSAEPDRILELQRAGYSVIGYNKSTASLAAGIQFCKQFDWISTEDNENLNAEIDMYMFKFDKDGRKMEIPSDSDDHALDAVRYGLHGAMSRTGSTHSQKQVDVLEGFGVFS